MTTTDKHGGRVETRTLTASEGLNEYSDWPSLGQVCRIERTIDCKKPRHEIAYAVTSLRASEASPAELLAISRGHWGIENRLHYVRDVAYDEDRSQVRTANAPEVLAALRNVALNLMRRAGLPNIAAALRRHAARPSDALALVGLAIPSN